ncbi:multiheme c-type cytochrome [Thermodesulfobacteriota bacterium]
MNRFSYILTVIIFLVFTGWGINIRSEILGDYLGYTACMECHPEIVDKWKATPHANAFENLKTQGAEKQENPGCFRCHVVAYNEDGGYIDMELTPELKDVQCESCHGPGRVHSESADPEELILEADEDTCRKCHTEGQDKDFNYEKKSKLVH